MADALSLNPPDPTRLRLLGRIFNKSGTGSAELPPAEKDAAVGLATPAEPRRAQDTPSGRPVEAPGQAAGKGLEITWARLMRRCRQMTKADVVFAVDGEGLVVGWEGLYGRAEVDRVAAHLSRAFDFLNQLTEIGSETESICAMYAEGRWLTAVRIWPRPDTVVTIGLIGPFTLIRQDRQRLRNTFDLLFAEEIALGNLAPDVDDPA